MKKERNWIIVDTQTGKALYGFGRKTLKFSSEETAQEVAEQFFEKYTYFLIFNIKDLVL